MKRFFKLLCMAICISLFVAAAVPTLEVEAKGKKQASVTPEQQYLNNLILYRDTLVAMGAAPSEIEKANQAIVSYQANMAQMAAQAAALAAYQASMANIEKTLQSGLKKSTRGVIFVGDSRFVQMHQAMGETGVNYVAQGWMGYDWLKDTAIPQIDPFVGKGSKIVINLGVNDIDNIDNYIALVNQKAAEWNAKGAKVYYATVNPVAEDFPKFKNFRVEEFNNKLKSQLIGVNIIDTYSFLKSYGYELVDHVHYKGTTSFNIYAYIMSQL